MDKNFVVVAQMRPTAVALAVSQACNTRPPALLVVFLDRKKKAFSILEFDPKGA